MTRYKEKLVLGYSIIMWLLVMLLAMHPYLESTLIRNESCVAMLLCTSIVCLIGILIAYKLRADSCTKHAVLLASLLIIGNAATLPLLEFTNNYGVNAAFASAKRLAIFAVLLLLGVPAVWVLLTVLEKLQREQPQKLFRGSMILSLGLAAVTMLFTQKEYSTAIVFGIAIAIPMLMLCVWMVSMAAKTTGRAKFVGIAAIFIMMGTLVLQSETGIPILFYITLVLWYTLFYPLKKNGKLIVLMFALPAAGLGILYVLHRFGSPQIPLIAELVEKVSVRIFEKDDQYQVRNGLRMIRDGGLFGNFRYTSNLPENDSDFMMASIFHYLGSAFLLLLGTEFLLFANAGAKKAMSLGMDLSHTLFRIVFILLTVMVCYNLLMIYDLVPVLGSQIPYTGRSAMYWMLSCGILGVLTFQQGTVERIYRIAKEWWNQ